MKIIATIGPNSSNKQVLYELVNKGVDTLRLNFSHFYEDEFIHILRDGRNIKEDIEIMADLCGKKIRIYEGINAVYKVYTNEEVYFCSKDVYELLESNNDSKTKIIPLTVDSKIISDNDIKNISMKDGTINFDVIEKDKVFIKARANDDGIVRAGKGCNLPGIDFGYKSLNEKDRSDIKWALSNKVNIISQSYVECAKEVTDIKSYIRKIGGTLDNIKIYSKIETNKGLINYKEIAECSDGIIIARGDLVPECGLINSVEEQFHLINNLKKMNYNKELIVATHVLDNMKIRNYATINEVESVYTFIKKGVTGFMLAGETSVGKYPIKAIEFLRELIDSYNN